MKSWIKRHWRWALPAAVAAAGVGAWLFFGYFAFHTILIDEEVDEALPFFTSGPAPSGIAGDETTEAMADAMNAAMADDDMAMVDEVDEPMPEMAGAAPTSEGSAEAPATAQPEGGDEARSDDGNAEDPEVAQPSEAQPDDGSATESEPEPAQPETTDPAPAVTEAPQPQIVVEAAGPFTSRSHPTEGRAQVLGDGSGQRFLRFEDFRTDNGPDLNVYLSAAPPDAPASDFVNDFVDLGDLKGNVGAQNYEIPVGLDLDHYSTVAVWCVRFGVVFGVAQLTAG